MVVEFPLRGERWVAVTTPGDRIPSHGVNMLGQRYAYDLLKVDERKGVHYHPAGSLRGLLIGGRTQECYAWGAAIHSPFDGEIVRAVDGVAERSWIHQVREAALPLKNALTFRPSRLPLILGSSGRHQVEAPTTAVAASSPSYHYGGGHTTMRSCRARSSLESREVWLATIGFADPIAGLW